MSCLQLVTLVWVRVPRVPIEIAVLLLGPTMVVARTEFPIVLRRTVSLLWDIAYFRIML